MDSSFGALILAAGKGTRMHSATPKVLQTILAEPMLAYVRSALKPVFENRIWTVVGHCSEMVRAAFPDAKYIEQKEQLGTGHALACALPALKEAGIKRVLVVNGDMPLLTTKVVEAILSGARGADVSVASIVLDDAGNYGRIVRENGHFAGIVEAKDYDIATLGAPSGEINAGVYVLDIDVAERLLPQIGCNNKSGEYYITDIAALALKENLDVRAVPCGHEVALLGVNGPAELADAEETVRTRIVNELLASGVRIHFPSQVAIGPYAVVEAGSQISGPCQIFGKSHISSGASIEAFCYLSNTFVDEGAVVHPFCHLESAHVGVKALVGPYTRLRIGAVLEEGSHAGNFVELKKAVLGKGAKANHLTYLGDAEIGAGTNIGAGTITCNYDGVNKHKTIIGENAFIGSNTALVAPVSVGDGVLVGAGSVITKNVDSNMLAVARGKQVSLPLKKNK